MKRVPQTMMDTLARLALEFDQISAKEIVAQFQALDGREYYTPRERACFNAGWHAAKSVALEQALRALVPSEEWDSTVRRWCDTYERLEKESGS